MTWLCCRIKLQHIWPSFLPFKRYIYLSFYTNIAVFWFSGGNLASASAWHLSTSFQRFSIPARQRRFNSSIFITRQSSTLFTTQRQQQPTHLATPHLSPSPREIDLGKTKLKIKSGTPGLFSAIRAEFVLAFYVHKPHPPPSPDEY